MPDWKQILRERLAHLDAHPARLEEITEELCVDLEEKYRRAIARGASEQAARAQVLSELGAPRELAQRLRDTEHWTPPRPEQITGTPHRGQMLANLLQDLRYGLRTLSKSPMFTMVAVLTLALGIGANTAVFSAVYGVLLKPLPFHEPEKLVWMWGVFSGGNSASTSPPDFLDYRAQAKSFESLAASIGGSGRIATSLSGEGEAVRLNSAVVTAGFFETLGVAPALGRTFSSAEERVGHDGVAILSHGMWQRRFGGDAGILGKKLTLDRKPTVVIGVMPQSFDFPEGAELWRPLAFGSEDNSVRRFHFLRPIGRLMPGVSIEQAYAELNTIAVGLEKTYPESNSTWRVRLQPLLEVFVGNVRTTMWVLLAAVAFVLLIACVNVANLLLARGSGRRREMAVRVALGASRRRIAAQLLAESALVALASGVLGFLLAYGATRWLHSLGPGFVPRQSNIQIELWMLGFTLAAALVTGLVFGLAPVAQALRSGSAEALREGGRAGGGVAMQRTRSVLVVAEVALSLMLLVGAGLLVRTFVNLARTDLGFSRENLLTTNLRLDDDVYKEEAKRSQFFRQLFEKLEAIPGMHAAAASSLRPLRGFTDMYFTIQGQPPPADGQRPGAQTRLVTRNYFAALGNRVLAGRVFGPLDVQGAPCVVVVNEAFVRQFLPSENPLGQVLTIDGQPPASCEIAGVVSATRQWTTVPPQPEMYRVLDQFPAFALDLLLRTDVSPASIAPAVRAAVRDLDRAQTLADFRTMEEVSDGAIAQERFSAVLMAGFAAVALLLAAVGISGVLSQAVAQRTHEIGVRMALGAGAGRVVSMVLGHGMKLALLGTALGAAGALALSRLLQPMLVGVESTDPATFAAVAALLLAIAAVACWIPARRAAHVDPLIALRHE